MVRGVVRDSEGGKHPHFRLKVTRLVKVWRNNKCKKPKSIRGKTVLVTPRWVQEHGRWHPVERHLRFIRALRRGQELNIEIAYSEMGRFNILELSREQREQAEGEGHHRRREREER